MGETELPVPGKARPVYRVVYIDEGLRGAVKARREALGQSVREFLEGLSLELGPLVRALTELGLSGRPEGGRRPARLPLPATLLEELRRASGQTGLPASRLLLLCLARATARKRRRPGARRLQQASTLAEADRRAKAHPGPRRRRGVSAPAAAPLVDPVEPNALEG
jgi:hypothetical protein